MKRQAEEQEIMSISEAQARRALRHADIPWHAEVDDPREDPWVVHDHQGILGGLAAAFAVGRYNLRQAENFLATIERGCTPATWPATQADTGRWQRWYVCQARASVMPADDRCNGRRCWRLECPATRLRDTGITSTLEVTVPHESHQFPKIVLDCADAWRLIYLPRNSSARWW
jgi:hypothetical protein